MGPDCDPGQLTTWAELWRWRAHRQAWEACASDHPDAGPVLVQEWEWGDRSAPCPPRTWRRLATAPPDAGAVVVVLCPRTGGNAPRSVAPGTLAYVLRDAATARRLARHAATTPATSPIDVWLMELLPWLDDDALVFTDEVPADRVLAPATRWRLGVAALRDAWSGGYVRWVPEGTVRDAVWAGLLVTIVTFAVVGLAGWLRRGSQEEGGKPECILPGRPD